MTDEKRSELRGRVQLKLVDVSFGASFKFWLAYLIVQVIAVLIGVGIFFALFSFIAQLIPSPYPYATVLPWINWISRM